MEAPNSVIMEYSPFTRIGELFSDHLVHVDTVSCH